MELCCLWWNYVFFCGGGSFVEQKVPPKVTEQCVYFVVCVFCGVVLSFFELFFILSFVNFVQNKKEERSALLFLSYFLFRFDNRFDL